MRPSQTIEEIDPLTFSNSRGSEAYGTNQNRVQMGSQVGGLNQSKTLLYKNKSADQNISGPGNN